MHFLVVSFTHKNTTLAIREKLAFSNDEQKETCLGRICADPSIDEAMVTSTCNRIEVFCSCSDIDAATMTILLYLHKRSGIPADELEARADIHEDRSAIHHMLSVVSSLDSMVVGETQISGQIKDAFSFAKKHGFCGTHLAAVIHHAFRCAAEVRNVTNISSKPVSIASVAIQQLKRDAGDLSGKRALLIGAGEMTVLTARYLMREGASITIMNRTRSKAEEIAKEFDAQVIDFGELSAVIDEFDLLVSATGATEAIIKIEDINFSIRERFWIDMAVPRDIEEFESDSITLYTVDDLKSIVDENLVMREDEAKASFGVIRKFTKSYYEMQQQQRIEPMIKEVYLRAMKAAKVESERAIRNGYLPKEYAAEAEKMAEQVLKRFLHDKMKRLRDVTEEEESESLMSALSRILGLNGQN
ncbi:MAG: glutamyl-tRNA reductase [Helicobacteraceae bacterium]|jgi:glutamyl-tRNA reductase|nr:glutamyl-tRNA reductase [Helicobacteraceae bacterium]